MKQKTPVISICYIACTAPNLQHIYCNERTHPQSESETHSGRVLMNSAKSQDFMPSAFITWPLLTVAIFLFATVASATPARYMPNNYNNRAPSSLPGAGQSFQIRGQTRNLNMMLVLKNGKDEINFIKPRRNYRAKVLATQF